MPKVAQFLQDDNGNFSATRLAFLSWIFGVLVMWGVSSYNQQKMQEIPQSVQVLIGVLMTGKVVQKFSEQPVSKSEVSQETVVAKVSQHVQPLQKEAAPIPGK